MSTEQLEHRAQPQQAGEQPSAGPLLPAPEHVLSTLESDGKRRWLKPRLSKGKWWHRRRAVAYVLMIVFIAVPHLRWHGKPLIQLDITSREFTILAHTFLPTDTLLLALLMLLAFVSIVFITAVAGRAWCGWGCPQTVYMEYLFRPIDRLFEGTVGKGGNGRRSLSAPAQVARFIVYVLLNMVLAHTFLAYFVGTEQLSTWLLGSPVNHPVAFAVMAVTTGLLTYDFYFFREQTCLIACPYGRFQSVMLDRNSMIVAYDDLRGEPRKKGKHQPNDGAGDCVDCNRCVVVCPTGIDIRKGLQMECINCTQCIDACDDVMLRVGSKPGLIRYSSQDALQGKKHRLLRARTVIYPLILALVGTGFVLALSTKYGFDARIIRGKGAPFTVQQDESVSNSFLLRLVNRSNTEQRYELSVDSPSIELQVIDDAGLVLPIDGTAMVPIQFKFPASLTQGDGNEPVTLRVRDATPEERLVEFRLLGPRS